LILPGAGAVDVPVVDVVRRRVKIYWKAFVLFTEYTLSSYCILCPGTQLCCRAKGSIEKSYSNMDSWQPCVQNSCEQFLNELFKGEVS